MAQLTQIQKTFLDNYIRKHSVLGKGKKKDADNFLRRLGKVEEELDKLPFYATQEIRNRLLAVDAKANKGDFSGAYKDLSKIKNDARKEVSNFRPDVEAIDLGREVKLFFDEADRAVVALQSHYQSQRDQQKPLSLPQAIATFLGTAQTKYDEIRRQVVDAARVFPTDLNPVLTTLNNRMQQVAELCSNPQRFHDADSMDEEARLTFADPKVAKLVEEEIKQDKVATKERTEKPATGFRRPETFDEFKMFEFADGLDLTGGPSDIQFKAQTSFEKIMADPSTSPDVLFDLALKTKDQIFWDYAKAKGMGSFWVRDMKAKDRLSKAQVEEAEAVASGMFAAITAKTPNTVDFKTGEMTIGGEKYGNATFLGKGGMGEVFKFQDKKDPSKHLVVKSVQSGSREEMEEELRSHWYLMQGDPTAKGRENIIEMKGIVRDDQGNIHMVMELADGGDMDGCKNAMSLASDNGSLSEEARNLLNQHLMRQAIEGVMYLRDQDAVHFDLKEVNVFMTGDGKVKVADFGGLQVHDDSHKQRDLADYPVSTGGYREPELDTLGKGGTKSDTHALGKMTHVMQTGDAGAWLEDEVQEISGSVKRIVDAMASQRSIDRPTLEGVLKSSYFQNADPDREQDMEELTKAVIAYGKKIGSQKLAGLNAEVAELEYFINACEEEDETWNPEYTPAKIKLAKKLQEVKTIKENAENDPEAKKLNARIKELSDRVTRPSDNLDQKPGEAMGDFLSALESTVGEAPQFVNLITMSVNSRFLERLGLKFQDVVAAAKIWEFDLNCSRVKLPLNETAASYAATALVNARGTINSLLGSVSDPSLKRLFTKGFKEVLDELVAQYAKLYPSENGRTAAVATGLDVVGDDPAVKKNDEKGTVSFDVEWTPFIEPAVVKIMDDVLDVAPVTSEFTVELKPGERDPSAFVTLAKTTVARYAKTVNDKLKALVTDIKKWREAGKQGKPNVANSIIMLVDVGDEYLIDLLKQGKQQLVDGLKAAGAAEVEIVGEPFAYEGTLVTLALPKPVPPMSSEHPEAAKFRLLSHGKLKVGPAVKVLAGAKAKSWFVFEDGQTGNFIVRWVAEDLSHSSMVVDDFDRMPMARFQQQFGVNIPPKPKDPPKDPTEDFATYSHATMDREGAESLLATKPVGSWLVRPSSKGGFAVSYSTRQKITHVIETTAKCEWTWEAVSNQFGKMKLIKP